MTMPKIFICYRREDNAYPAHQIYGVLTNHFGSESVVFDVDTIPLGIDFREYLNKEVSKCDILLAIIGDQWIELLKQRIDEPNDFVRIEIQAALEREIPVVPILVGNASVPLEKNLPPELARLAYRNAAEVRAGPDFQTHLKRLIDGLDYLLTGRMAAKKRKLKEEAKGEAVPKTYTNSIGMEFNLIASGFFTMGSSSSGKMQKPPHEVQISKSFYLQTTQVTQGQWKMVMGDKPSSFKKCGDECPVESVSWEETQNFINKLNEMGGTDKFIYRLPTEAEWEYACRAGTTTEYSYGEDTSKLNEYAWYLDNSVDRTHPVGQKKPNPWGLYDMHGNVCEWVEDDWHDNYESAPNDGRAWIDESRGADRVFRGGSWGCDAHDCRLAFRNGGPAGGRWQYVGFRLARSVALSP